MVIISDTSTISNLIQLGEIELLNRLLGSIFIPQQVYDELARLPAQKAVVERLDWLKVVAIKDHQFYSNLLEKIDPGEAGAITLAIELQAELLVMDEKKGRQIAAQYRLPVIGLLGLLLEAKQENLLNAVKPLIDRLIYETGFRISPNLYQEILRRAGE